MTSSLQSTAHGPDETRFLGQLPWLVALVVTFDAGNTFQFGPFWGALYCSARSTSTSEGHSKCMLWMRVAESIWSGRVYDSTSSLLCVLCLNPLAHVDSC